MDVRAHGIAVFINRFEKRAHHQHEPIHAALGQLPALLIPPRCAEPFERAQLAPDPAEKTRSMPPQSPFAVEPETKHFYQQAVAHLVSWAEAVLARDARQSLCD